MRMYTGENVRENIILVSADSSFKLHWRDWRLALAYAQRGRRWIPMFELEKVPNFIWEPISRIEYELWQDDKFWRTCPELPIDYGRNGYIMPPGDARAIGKALASVSSVICKDELHIWSRVPTSLISFLKKLKTPINISRE